MSKRVHPGDPKVSIAYVRSSTARQDLGPEDQRKEISEWAARNGVTVVAVFEDRISGTTDGEDRPQLAAALAALREHGAGLLVAARRDRVARDLIVAAMIERAVKAAGATLRTADGMSDCDGPEGIMIRAVVDAASALYVARLRANTRAALAVKRARGEKLGGRAPFGFQVAADGIRLERVEAEQETVAVVRQLRTEGVSLRAVVAHLADSGVSSRAGRPFGLTQVARMARATA